MCGKKANILIVIECDHIFTYTLDDKNSWEVGRVTQDYVPDIPLHSATISRKQGKFQNVDGVWFYLDYDGKNQTFYNHKKLTTGLNGKIKPVLLNDGDAFVFGSGEEEAINQKDIWAIYITRYFGEEWRVIDSREYGKILFVSGEGRIMIDNSQKGFVIEQEKGIAIYMGDLTYLIGDIELIGQ